MINQNNLLRTDDQGFRIWTARGEPQPLDMVLTREAPVGEVALIPHGMRACLGQRMMLFRADPTVVIPGFMVVAFQSPVVKSRLLGMADGSTVSHVRVGDAKSLLLPVPSLPEQELIASSVAAVATREETENATVRALRAVKTALAAALLAGQVRVALEMANG